MSVSLGTMLPGQKVNFSLDLASLIPAGQTLASVAVNVRSGIGGVTFTNVSASTTKAIFRAEAVTVGRVVADVIGTFSDGQIDGDQVEISVA